MSYLIKCPMCSQRFGAAEVMHRHIRKTHKKVTGFSYTYGGKFTVSLRAETLKDLDELENRLKQIDVIVTRRTYTG